MSEHFSKHLSKIKAPKIAAPFHKRKLKNAVRAVYFNKGKVSKGSSLFDDLKNMSLKKLIPATVLAVFVFTLAGQSFLTWRNTAYAQELIEETIEKIESRPLTEEEAAAMSTIQILEELKKNGDIKYLGEEIYPSKEQDGTERKLQKFGFTNQDLLSDLTIDVWDEKEVDLVVNAPLQQSMPEYFEIKIDETGQVLNLKELKLKLKDPQLKEPWLKNLLKISNKEWSTWTEKPIAFGQVLDEAHSEGMNMTLDEKQKQIDHEKKCNEKSKKIFNQILPFIIDAEVLMNDWSGGCGPNEEDFLFSISFFRIAGQQEKNSEAKAGIQKLIDQLSQFKTETAQTKIKILEKALKSKQLSLYSNLDHTVFSFPYRGAGDDEELVIWIEPENETEDFIKFSFQSEVLNIGPGGKGEWIDVKVEDGKILNRDELEKKLKDSHLNDDLLRYIIETENKSVLDGIKKYDIDTPDKFSPHPFKQYDEEGKPELKLEVFKQLQEILQEADVPVLSLSMDPAELMNGENKYISNDPTLLYSFGIYPLGNPQVQESSAAIEKLDMIIKNLKDSITSENQSNIEILKNALKANELRYEGEEKWDTKTVQKISFRDPDISRRINLYIDSSDGTVQFVVDSILSDDPYNRFQLDVDEKGNILNLEALKKRLNDPHLKKPWIKDLVRKTNLEWIKTMDEMSERNAWNETYRLQEKNIYIQLEELNKEATVIIGGLGASYHGVIPSYTIDLYSITE